ncbi:MAG TPA: hypothetical protein VN133_07075 [Humibacter sp.]|nr:hypothetical protein [Humibacter sp.]
MTARQASVDRTQRVPDPGPSFWVIKGLSTAMGEAASDYLIHVMPPVTAVLLGFAGFVIALTLQLRQHRYVRWTYWFAVAMVGVFGTMAADVVHVVFGVPYVASSLFYAAVLAAVFGVWWLSERTLSVHAIDTRKRELFYWAAVIATFAMGTAAGDFAAITLHLGYGGSAAVFAVVIVVPALGYRLLRWNAVFAFWFAYVITRPLGASLADWLGKPAGLGGLGVGDGVVAGILLLAMAVLVLVVPPRVRVSAAASVSVAREPAS